MHKTLVVAAALLAMPLSVLAAAPKTLTLDVQNMTCSVCPITVKKSLQGVSGVSDVSVDFKQKTARVTFDQDKAKPADLVAATTNAGFPATVQP